MARRADQRGSPGADRPDGPLRLPSGSRQAGAGLDIREGGPAEAQRAPHRLLTPEPGGGARGAMDGSRGKALDVASAPGYPRGGSASRPGAALRTRGACAGAAPAHRRASRGRRRRRVLSPGSGRLVLLLLLVGFSVDAWIRLGLGIELVELRYLFAGLVLGVLDQVVLRDLEPFGLALARLGQRAVGLVGVLWSAWVVFVSHLYASYRYSVE